jgi:hypothetical protein
VRGLTYGGININWVNNSLILIVIWGTNSNSGNTVDLLLCVYSYCVYTVIVSIQFNCYSLYDNTFSDNNVQIQLCYWIRLQSEYHILGIELEKNHI